MNIVEVVGNLTKDPVIRVTKTGKSVASFTVACNRNYTTPQGEVKQLTDWVSVVAWGGLAESAGNHLKKGSRAFVAGRYSTRSYDAQDGTKRYVTEVVASMIAIPLSTASSQGRGNFNQFGAPATSQQEMNAPPCDEDIPF